MLQWGRDLLVAESICELAPIANVASASMGPRLVSRGKTATPAAQPDFSIVRFNGAATC